MSSAAIDLIVEHLERPERQVRRNAIEALDALGSPEALRLLADQVVDNDDAAVRAHALSRLTALTGERLTAAVGHLDQRMADRAEPFATRLRIYRSLASLGGHAGTGPRTRGGVLDRIRLASALPLEASAARALRPTLRAFQRDWMVAIGAMLVGLAWVLLVQATVGYEGYLYRALALMFVGLPALLAATSLTLRRFVPPLRWHRAPWCGLGVSLVKTALVTAPAFLVGYGAVLLLYAAMDPDRAWDEGWPDVLLAVVKTVGMVVVIRLTVYLLARPSRRPWLVHLLTFLGALAAGLLAMTLWWPVAALGPDALLLLVAVAVTFAWIASRDERPERREGAGSALLSVPYCRVITAALVVALVLLVALGFHAGSSRMDVLDDEVRAPGGAVETFAFDPAQLPRLIALDVAFPQEVAFVRTREGGRPEEDPDPEYGYGYGYGYGSMSLNERRFQALQEIGYIEEQYEIPGLCSPDEPGGDDAPERADALVRLHARGLRAWLDPTRWGRGAAIGEAEGEATLLDLLGEDEPFELPRGRYVLAIVPTRTVPLAGLLVRPGAGATDGGEQIVLQLNADEREAPSRWEADQEPRGIASQTVAGFWDIQVNTASGVALHKFHLDSGQRVEARIPGHSDRADHPLLDPLPGWDVELDIRTADADAPEGDPDEGQTAAAKPGRRGQDRAPGRDKGAKEQGGRQLACNRTTGAIACDLPAGEYSLVVEWTAGARRGAAAGMLAQLTLNPEGMPAYDLLTADSVPEAEPEAAGRAAWPITEEAEYRFDVPFRQRVLVSAPHFAWRYTLENSLEEHGASRADVAFHDQPAVEADFALELIDGAGNLVVHRDDPPLVDQELDPGSYSVFVYEVSGYGFPSDTRLHLTLNADEDPLPPPEPDPEVGVADVDDEFRREDI